MGQVSQYDLHCLDDEQFYSHRKTCISLNKRFLPFWWPKIKQEDRGAADFGGFFGPVENGRDEECSLVDLIVHGRTLSKVGNKHLIGQLPCEAMELYTTAEGRPPFVSIWNPIHYVHINKEK